MLEPALFLRKESAANDSRLAHSVLRGSLVVHVRKPTNIKSIKLYLRGRCQICWPDKDSSEDRFVHSQSHELFGKGSLNVTVASVPSVSSTRIGTHYIVLPGESNGGDFQPDLGSILPSFPSSSSSDSARDKSIGGGMVVPVGIYEFPFELLVPVTIPESIECIYGWVRYHLSAKIERPSVLYPNLVSSKPIQVLVAPDEHLMHRTINLRSGPSKYLSCAAQIHGRSFALGTKIPMVVTITPFDLLKVEFSEVTILQQVSYRLSGQSESKHEPIAQFGFKDSGQLSAKEDSKGKLLVSKTEIAFSVLVPNTCVHEILHPTCTSGPISARHRLKLVLEFSTRDQLAFDVIFEVPIQLLAPACTKSNMVLPQYDTILPTVLPPDYTPSAREISNCRVIPPQYDTLLKA